MSLYNFIVNLYKNFFSPQTCLNCGELYSGYICADCVRKIDKINGNLCSYCGSLLSGESKSDSLCSFCKEKEFSFYKLRSFGRYEGILRKAIINFKYNKIYSVSSELARLLKEMLIEHFPDEDIDFIETVPDFDIRQDEAYFNYENSFKKTERSHMELLASELSELTKIPFADNIIKIRKTSRQQMLNKNDRLFNLKNVFKARNPLLYYRKNILLVDDVVTTGSTINEVSCAMKRCMADKIYVMTLARVNA